MNARDEVLWQLAGADLPGWQSKSASTYRPSHDNADPRDVDLAHALYRCVLKNLGLLRHLTEHYAGRPINRIDPSVQMVLAIGIAQLRFFDRLPPYAVVDQAVNQTKRMKLGKAGGFVNAVLRRALREPEPKLPTTADPQDYARIVLSHPPEIFQRMVRVMGAEKALDLAARNNAEPPLIVRGKPEPREGVTITPHAQPGFLVVTGAGESVLAEWANAGIAQVQDPTSAMVVEQFDLTNATLILDRCCGVGTKTLQLAKAAPQATVVAMDKAAFRVETLKRSVERAGLKNVRVIRAGQIADIFRGTGASPVSSDCEKLNTGEAPVPRNTQSLEQFDRILIDVPCSNSGVLMRRPEARYRQSTAALDSLRELQRFILLDTLPHLAPGGQLLYSTCSIWPEENEEQIQWLVQQTPVLKLFATRATLPSISDEPRQHHDGGFFALLVKES